MQIRRRYALLAGVPVSVSALVVLGIASIPAASAHRISAAAATRTHKLSLVRIGPPIGRPKPSGLKPYLGRADQPSPWTPLNNPPPFGTPGTMLVENNGTVLVHDEPDNNVTGGTNEWWALTPDSHGSYVNGTWSQIASMPADYTPLYFASAILPDGRMIVEGGEYIGENAVWSDQGAIYDPVSNTWTSVAPPQGWTNMGDAESVVLPDGTFMLQQPCNTCLTNPNLTVDDALLNAKTLTWTVIPAAGKNDPNDEEGWSLLPDGQLLTLDLWVPDATQLFDPRSDTWSFDGNVAANGNPVDPFPVVEIGPQDGLPNGDVFVVGAGTSTEEPPTTCTDDVPTQTALYEYQAGTPGTWTAGPEIPPVDGQEMDSTDGPGATLPDGNVLFDASACVYNTPMNFFLYNASANTISQIPGVPNDPNDTSYATRLLDLPNGQVLFDDGSNQMFVYTADGTPNPSWEPSITSLSSTQLTSGGTYTLNGTQLAGLDQGAAYGDDFQDNTNFPIVRITNDATGVVTYTRTTNWMDSIAPGVASSTNFTLPPNTPTGQSTLVVVANGIASQPVTVTVY